MAADELNQRLRTLLDNALGALSEGSRSQTPSGDRSARSENHHSPSIDLGPQIAMHMPVAYVPHMGPDLLSGRVPAWGGADERGPPANSRNEHSQQLGVRGAFDAKNLRRLEGRLRLLRRAEALARKRSDRSLQIRAACARREIEVGLEDLCNTTAVEYARIRGIFKALERREHGAGNARGTIPNNGYGRERGKGREHTRGRSCDRGGRDLRWEGRERDNGRGRKYGGNSRAVRRDRAASHAQDVDKGIAFGEERSSEGALLNMSEALEKTEPPEALGTPEWSALELTEPPRPFESFEQPGAPNAFGPPDDLGMPGMPEWSADEKEADSWG